MSEIILGQLVRVVGHAEHSEDIPSSNEIGKRGIVVLIERCPLGSGLDIDVLLEGEDRPISFSKDELEPA